MRVYLVDVGFLLSEGDKEFECYNTVYDKRYGYYDIEQFYIESLYAAVDYVDRLISQATTVKNIYGIISITDIDADVEDDVEDIPVEYEEYLLDNVIYSIAKINGIVTNGFLSNKK